MDKWFYLMIGFYISAKLLIGLIKIGAFNLFSEYSEGLTLEDAWIAIITLVALIFTIISMFNF